MNGGIESKRNTDTSAADRVSLQKVDAEQTGGTPEVAGARTGYDGRDGSKGVTARAGDAARAGLRLLTSAKDWATSHKKAAAAAAIGFAILLPPVAGQVMHPGIPSAQNPVAAQVQQANQLPTNGGLNGELKAALGKVPQQGTGAGREATIRDVMTVQHKAESVTDRAREIDGSAHRTVNALDTPWDARAGTAVDLYWFGVTPEGQVLHLGEHSVDKLDDQVSDLQKTATEAKASAREEVSKLMCDESPAYATLHSRYVTVKNEYTTARHVQDLAHKASSAIDWAVSAQALAVATPPTILVPHSHTVTTNGKTTTVQDPPTIETNPARTSADAVALAAKISADGSLDDLKTAASKAQDVLGDSADIDGDLITPFSFFSSGYGGVFDLANSISIGSKVDKLEGAADAIGDRLEPEYKSLDAQVNAQITARYDEIAAGGNTTVENWN
ncbi:MAG: hypothetical protein IPJ65_04975 [Archangiaceae bacterium]|nr:hypothetical protein [Archangiaceae bacterium]